LCNFSLEGDREPSVVNIFTGSGPRRQVNDIAWNGDNLILVGTNSVRGSTNGTALVIILYSFPILSALN
jgi:hypothetical protein